ncbi:MAG: hypothetical protein WD649_03320 [Thermoleophilaceae bacterium]
MLAAVVAALVISAPSGAARPRPPRLAPLWATINVCDSPSKPNAVGVRGRMSARSRGTRMYMRFRLHWFDVAQGRFRPIRDAVSPLVYAGRGLRRGRQAGFTFELDAPENSYLIRGRTEFFWYKRRQPPRGSRRPGPLVLVKRRERVTRGGKKHVRGGDPPGYSAGTCDLR